MSVIHIRKGRDIKLKGAATKELEETTVPSRVAIQPPDFRGMRLRLLVKPEETVKVGTPLLEDKTHPAIKIVSPVSGRVEAVNRGEKRALLQIVIETDGSQQELPFRQFAAGEIDSLSREDIIQHLLEGGVWPCIRQRPFSRIANPEAAPKSIFIQAINTEPLSLDADFILNHREKEFQVGVAVLSKLTKGDVHLCCAKTATSVALTQSKNVKIHRFSGPHPSGNVSTHIHHIDPINKGDLVWYIRCEDVLRIADLFLKGVFSPERFVAVTGEGASKRVYKKTIIGVPIAHLLEEAPSVGMRCLSGSVLTGKNVGGSGFLCFYDSQITILPEGGKRHFLGWLMPGFNKYSFSRTYASALKNGNEVSLDTDKNGSPRAMVMNHIYDDGNALNIMTYFLLKAVLGGDIDEAERLGILECDEEDFALCTFACPSKTDVGGIIRQGLDVIEKEG